MAKHPKQLTPQEIIAQITGLPLSEILNVNFQTVQLIEEMEAKAKEKMADAEAELEMIRKGNGGNK